ncbi:MAG: hypothetical protein ACWGMZ_09635, partial [Thermoguttaceae bacterium]
LERSDAYRRGLRQYDEIVSFAGRAVTTPNAFKNILGILPPGVRVPLTYRREGERHDILVRLPRLHSRAELLTAMESLERQMPLPVPPPAEEPKPNEHKPGKKPRLQKSTPPEEHQPKIESQTPPEMPEIVKRHFHAKRGYANYFFNKQNQERIWNAWNKQCNFAHQHATWIFAGNLSDGDSYGLRIGPGGVLLKTATIQLQWTVGDDLSATLDPPNSGGLFAALYLWRRLAVEGFSRFGDVYYLGTIEPGTREGLVDMLVGTYKGAECRFHFEPKTGDLSALEFFSADNRDPCEIYFSDYREFQGRLFPTRLEVRCGDIIFERFTINELRLEEKNER